MSKWLLSMNMLLMIPLVLASIFTVKDLYLEEELEAGTSGKDSSLSLSSIGRGIGFDLALEAEAVDLVRAADIITFREGGCGKFLAPHQS